MENVSSDLANDAVAVQQSPQEQNDQKQVSIKNLNNNLIIDIEELLGSVTTFPTSGNDGPAVRTSARVIHKLRMDSTPLPQPEKKETHNESSTVNPPKTPSTTKTHVKVQWINEERNFFFDALNEHGRDFEQISKFINLKMKRKTSSEKDYKTKEHIRQLYYQLFQKASKYIRFSDDVKKIPQELYTLINYGEMRRKQLLMGSDKNWLKLRDLIYKGHVTIRSKGKNIKVKTPSCRALRMLNQVEGNAVEDMQLPLRIEVAIRPCNMKAHGYVQTLAQNPRVRMASLPLQKRVATLIHTLQQKWRSPNFRCYEKYVGSKIQQHGLQKIGEEIVSQSHADLAQLKAEEPVLRFKPPRDAVIYRPMIQLNELLSKTSICLNSYEDRIGAKTRGESLSTEKFSHIKDLKHHSKRMRFDSASDKTVKPKVEEPGNSKALEEIGIAVIDYKSNDSIDSDLKKKEITEEEIQDMKLKQSLSLDLKKDDHDGISLLPLTTTEVKIPDTEKQATAPPAAATATATSTIAPAVAPVAAPTKAKKNTSVNGHIKSIKELFKPLLDEESLKMIRRGWSLTTVGDLTIGDLYLMFGSDYRLILEYEIVKASEITGEVASEPVENKLEKTIGSKLKNLMSIANLLEGTKSLTDSNHHGDSMFKIPVGVRDIYPRGKPPKYRHQLIRPSGHQLITGASVNHVVRDLYQTPPPTVNPTVEDPKNKDVEVTKIIEERIQDYTGSINASGYSENSNSSMRSLLDKCFSANSLRKGTSISDDSTFSMKLLNEDAKNSSDDIDNCSMSSLLFRLDNQIFEENIDQG